jgi:hypothetical protein
MNGHTKKEKDMSKKTEHVVISKEAHSKGRFIAGSTPDQFIGTTVERLLNAEHARLRKKMAAAEKEKEESEEDEI